jgi:hypothetical protein
LLICEAMGWTLPDLLALPVDVYDVLVEMMIKRTENR